MPIKWNPLETLIGIAKFFKREIQKYNQGI